jgi:hypothetical protein
MPSQNLEIEHRQLCTADEDGQSVASQAIAPATFADKERAMMRGRFWEPHRLSRAGEMGSVNCVPFRYSFEDVAGPVW